MTDTEIQRMLKRLRGRQWFSPPKAEDAQRAYEHSVKIPEKKKHRRKKGRRSR